MSGDVHWVEFSLVDHRDCCVVLVVFYVEWVIFHTMLAIHSRAPAAAHFKHFEKVEQPDKSRRDEPRRAVERNYISHWRRHADEFPLYVIKLCIFFSEKYQLPFHYILQKWLSIFYPIYHSWSKTKGSASSPSLTTWLYVYLSQVLKIQCLLY